MSAAIALVLAVVCMTSLFAAECLRLSTYPGGYMIHRVAVIAAAVVSFVGLLLLL